MSLNNLKNRIIELNNLKNNYATKKLKNDINERDEKDLVSTLIYIIAEIKKYASEIGIDNNGKITKECPELNDFNHINESVKNLKKQILFLINSSVKEIREEINNQAHKEIIEKKKNDSNLRVDEIKNRLKKQLQNKETS